MENKEVGMPDIKKEVGMPDIKKEVGMPDIKKEVGMSDIKKEVGMPDIKKEVRMPDINKEVKELVSKGYKVASLKKIIGIIYSSEYELEKPDLEKLKRILDLYFIHTGMYNPYKDWSLAKYYIIDTKEIILKIIGKDNKEWLEGKMSEHHGAAKKF